jgi:hypothetical protein
MLSVLTKVKKFAVTKLIISEFVLNLKFKLKLMTKITSFKSEKRNGEFYI